MVKYSRNTPHAVAVAVDLRWLAAIQFFAACALAVLAKC